MNDQLPVGTTVIKDCFVVGVILVGVNWY